MAYNLEGVKGTPFLIALNAKQHSVHTCTHSCTHTHTIWTENNNGENTQGGGDTLTCFVSFFTSADQLSSRTPPGYAIALQLSVQPSAQPDQSTQLTIVLTNQEQPQNVRMGPAETKKKYASHKHALRLLSSRSRLSYSTLDLQINLITTTHSTHPQKKTKILL